MAAVKKICRVCGKEYTACLTKTPNGVFRWQEVSCSPECGAKYLADVLAARGETPAKTTKRSKKAVAPVEEVVVDETKEDAPTEQVDAE